MRKYNSMLKVVTIINILFFIAMPPLGMRFAHGVITTVATLGSAMIEEMHLARICFVVLLLSVLLFIFQIVSVWLKKAQASQKFNTVLRVFLIADSVFCVFFLFYLAIRFYYLHAIEAAEEWNRVNPFVLAAVLWIAMMLAVVVFCKLKNEKAKFGFIIACYCLFAFSVIVILGIMLNLFFEISASIIEYCAVFCFVEDMILILLLTMRKKGIEQGTVSVKTQAEEK